MIRKPVLLAVDEEPGMLALVERFAGPAGFTDANAGHAIACIAGVAPDVALVDLRMPEVGGLEVLRAIRIAQPQCQVILMTAHAEVDSAIHSPPVLPSSCCAHTPVYGCSIANTHASFRGVPSWVDSRN